MDSAQSAGAVAASAAAGSAEDQRKHQEFAKEYVSSLVDLTYNSKPLIDMLTILAEENVEHGQVIVDAVEQHISKVATDYKLPVLYLIDSIVKNVGHEYTALFSNSIVNIFCGVFERVNEKVRTKMYALRQTWNDVFSQPKLYALDLKVNTIDRAWPITAKVAPAIHVNPNFLKTQQQQQLQQKPEKDLQAQLLDKQRELLELQKMAKKLAVEDEMKQRLLLQQQRQAAEADEARFSPPPAELTSSRPNTTHSTMGRSNAPNHLHGGNAAHPNRVRVAPVNPAMLARVRDPRLARMQQQQQQQQPPPMHLQLQQQQQQQQHQPQMMGLPVALTAIPSYTASAQQPPPMHQQPKNLNGTNPFAVRTTAAAAATVAPNIPQQILADLDEQIAGRAPREIKQRVAHKSPPTAKAPGGGGGRGAASGKSAASSSSSRSGGSKSAAGGVSGKSTSSSSSSRDRDRGSSSRSHDYKASSSSSRRDERGSGGGKKRTSSTSSTSPNKKSPKRGTSSDRTAKSAPHSPASAAALASDQPAAPVAKKSTLAETYRSYLERNRDKSGSPTAAAAAASSSSAPPSSQQQQQRGSDSTATISATNALLLESIGSNGIDARMVLEIAAKMKRMSEGQSGADAAEPLSKKTRSEMDVLFGSEDVDLRQLMNPAVLGPMMSVSTASDSDATNANSPSKPPPKQLDMDMRPQQMTAAAAVAAEHKTIASLKRKNDSQSTSSGGTDDHHNNGNDGDGDANAPNDDDSHGSGADSPALSAASGGSVGSGSLAKRRTTTRKSKWSAPVPVPPAVHVAPLVAAPHPQQLQQPPMAAFEMPAALPAMLGQQQPLQSSAVGVWPQPVAPMMWQQPPPGLGAPSIPGLTGGLPMAPAAAFLPAHIVDPLAAAAAAVVPMQLPMTLTMAPLVPGAAVAAPPPAAAELASFATHDAAVSRSITIDQVSREIRYYGETAIAFMGASGAWEPRELGFNAGDRVVRVDHTDAIRLVFNDAYTPFSIGGRTCQIRFGTPMRELYINQQWYECLFGEPSFIQLADGRRHRFDVDGPAPQVRIGALRRDLCAGRVDLVVDSLHKIGCFLDALPQTFELDGRRHVLQFYDYFQTAMIDGQPFGPVQYGGMPKAMCIGGRQRFIRFTVLPEGLQAGRVWVKGMQRTDRCRGMASPEPQAAGEVPAVAAATPAETGGGFQLPAGLAGVLAGQGSGTAASASDASPLNISDLLQKLVASGIIDNSKSQDGSGAARPQSGSPAPAAPAAARGTPVNLARPETIKQRQAAHVDVLFAGLQCSSCGVRFPADQAVQYGAHLDWHFRQNRRDRELAKRAHSRRWYGDVGEWVAYEERDAATAEGERSWFEQQQADLGADLGTQAIGGGGGATGGGAGATGGEDASGEAVPSCVADGDDVDRTCDMCHDRFETFYNEETEDWHLRNAVRAEDGSGTFHPVCWKDHRAALAVETTRAAREASGIADADGDNAVDMPEKMDDVNIVLDDDDDDVIVLPAEEAAITEIPDDNDENPTTPTPPVAADAELGAAAAASTPAPAPAKLAAPAMNYEPVGNESDLHILVPQISVLDLDEIVEKTAEERAAVDAAAAAAAAAQPVRIKEEPRNKGYSDERGAGADEEDGFEEIGTIESAAIDDNSADILLQEIVDSTSAADAATSPPATASTPTPADGQTAEQSDAATVAVASVVAQPEVGLDGNIQPVVAAAPPSANANKIRINIASNVSNKIVINSSENHTEKAQQPQQPQPPQAHEQQQQQQQQPPSGDNNNGDLGAGAGRPYSNDPLQPHHQYQHYADGTFDTVMMMQEQDRNLAQQQPAAPAEPVEPEIEFEYKESMRGRTFERMPRVSGGVEASGLCSIM